jgi:hypothetical protein
MDFRFVGARTLVSSHVNGETSENQNRAARKTPAGRPRSSLLDPIEQARVRRQRHRESKRNAGMVPTKIWLPKAWRDAVIARGETLQDAAQEAFRLLMEHWESNQES